MLIPVPTLAMPKIDALLPRRAKLRTESEDPTFSESKTEICEPSKKHPQTEMAEPTLAKDRRLMTLPRWR
jgi:hypothetical protein